MSISAQKVFDKIRYSFFHFWKRGHRKLGIKRKILNMIQGFKTNNKNKKKNDSKITLLGNMLKIFSLKSGTRKECTSLSLYY